MVWGDGLGRFCGGENGGIMGVSGLICWHVDCYVFILVAIVCSLVLMILPMGFVGCLNAKIWVSTSSFNHHFSES